LTPSFDRLPPEGLPRWLPAVGAAAVMLPAASTPCWAKALSRESSGTIHCINSKIIRSLTVLKSGFRFQTTLLLGGPCVRRFRPSNSWVLAGAILRITPGWAHHVDVTGFDGRVPASTAPNLRVVFEGIPIRCFSRRWRA
jgi:hypothetical protein